MYIYELRSDVRETRTHIMSVLVVFAFLVVTIIAFAPGRVHAQNNAQSELIWVTPAPGADLAKLKAQVESQGGEVLTLAPERRLLVRYPAGKAQIIQGLSGIEAIQPAAFVQEAPGPAGKGLGALPPTPEEEEYIRQTFSPVKVVEPNTLSADRAMLDGQVTLPLQVDNSLSNYFPPIRSQGSQGSCTAWASAYYYNTYTQAMDEGLNVSSGNNNYICSPAFIYNLINWGEDGGAYTTDAVSRLNEVGCCNWTLLPYNQGDWTTWPTEVAWVNAIQRRTDSSFMIGDWYYGCSDAEMDAIKQHLANGNVAATETDVYENWYNNYYLNDGQGVNNGVLFANGGNMVGGHAMTIVGYDDNRSYFDGATTRYGAFLLANSWGSSWGRTNTGGSSHGFMWVAYDFFKAQNYCFGVAYFNSDRDNYRSRLYAVSGLNHAQRGYVRYRGGVGPSAAPAWTSYYPIYDAGGTSLAISDTKRVAVDLTDGIGSIGFPNVSLFAQMSLSGSASGNGTITSAVFYYDFDGDGSFDSVASPDPTVTVSPGGTGYATVNFFWCSGELDHFSWSTVSSPQEVSQPFSVTITAKCSCDDTVSDFTDTVTLSGLVLTTRTIGSGTNTWNYPLSTYYHDARTQVIYLQSELGASTTFTGMALDVTTLPGQTLGNWTIRMKYTSMSSYSTAAWEGPASGWITVYQQATNITSTGWVWFDFSTPFDYNGTDNLLVDFSFNNSSWTSDGYVRYSTVGANRAIYYRTDSGYGDPLNWTDTSNPTPGSINRVPNLRLTTADSVSISPLSSGNFTNGVWNGSITVNETASQMLLRAFDSNGHKGDSNLFNVVLPTYTLSVTTNNGSVVKVPDLPEYDEGTIVALTPTPNTGYHFTSWSGDVPAGHEADNPLNLTMDANKTLTANFAINQYTLTYTAGANGSISGTSPQTVNHGSNGTEVMAVPNIGYHFVKWSDDVMTESRTDTNVTADITVTANFEEKPIVKDWKLY